METQYQTTLVNTGDIVTGARLIYCGAQIEILATFEIRGVPWCVYTYISHVNPVCIPVGALKESINAWHTQHLAR